tara:strand:+ start:130 stop:672 length:543 start_codon:yes stop_codon:yes gene_type:complete
MISGAAFRGGPFSYLMHPMLIRTETPDDIDAIRDLTAAAFAPMPYCDGTEPEMIDRLRADDDLHLSLIAIDGEVLIGHVAFSPARLPIPGKWFALGPISVAPARQRTGIGTALIETGLAELRGMGAAGCVLIGDPAYYARFGFRSDPGLAAGDVPRVNVMGLSFTGPPPTGAIRFAPGLT